MKKKNKNKNEEKNENEEQIEIEEKEVFASENVFQKVFFGKKIDFEPKCHCS